MSVCIPIIHKRLNIVVLGLFLCLSASLFADSLSPYTQTDQVPQNATGLWADCESSILNGALDTQILKTWEEEGVICNLIRFRVGKFKGEDSWLAAFYCYPKEADKDNRKPGIVWSHGGGQRAEVKRGIYFGRMGYASIDINWLGRELIKGMDNTDWGKIDPTQGPHFYPKALRKSFKRDLMPDAHTIDPVVSPRNSNWFMLAYAGRRAVTFLSKQKEVDAGKIGVTGYSMGGVITSMCATDPRVKAAVPMVGGSGYLTQDFPGMPGSGMLRAFKHPALYARTIDSQAYWQHVKCPVLFLSSTNDFHGIFDRITQCTELIPHSHWRIGQKLHDNHNLSANQYILLKRWFDCYLKKVLKPLPANPVVTLDVDVAKSLATFTAEPDAIDELKNLTIYYSFDPNPRSRFWHTALSTRQSQEKNQYLAKLPLESHLPLFVFAQATYNMPAPEEAFNGERTKHYELTSAIKRYLPKKIDLDALNRQAKVGSVFYEFKKHRFQNWAGKRGNMVTYQFRSPSFKVPDQDQKLRITLNEVTGKMSLRLRAGKNEWQYGNKKSKSSLAFSKQIKPEVTEIIIAPSDFKTKQTAMTDWQDITTFTLGIYDGTHKRMLDQNALQKIIKHMDWIKE